ncbi:MAG: DUF4446 family protein [Patescibacteria group bacterium]
MFEFERDLMTTESLISLGLGIWLAVVSVVFFLFASFFRRLTKGASGEDLKKVLEKILVREARNSEEINELKKGLAQVREEGFGHIQKVGLVRFNPFREMGGGHSFSLVVLDGKGSGVAITGLHTRERTRVYVKGIKNGRGELELSAEEKKALAKAQKA